MNENNIMMMTNTISITTVTMGNSSYAYILDTFPIVKREDEKKWGDYRTQRVILEIYDALAETIRTGQPYQTLLNPPPADARCCHPPRT